MRLLLLYVSKRLTCLYRALRFTTDHRPSTIDYDGRSALLEVAAMGSTCGRTVASVSSR